MLPKTHVVKDHASDWQDLKIIKVVELSAFRFEIGH